MNSYHIPVASVTRKSTIVLKSKDGDEFCVPIKIAIRMGTVRNLLQLCGIDEDSEVDEIIPLPGVNSVILQMVIDWLAYHDVDDVPELLPPKDSRKPFFVPKWDKKFLNVSQQMLCDLLTAADYLHITGLMAYITEIFADMMKRKTVDEIRDTFGIKVLPEPEKPKPIAPEKVEKKYNEMEQLEILDQTLESLSDLVDGTLLRAKLIAELDEPVASTSAKAYKCQMMKTDDRKVERKSKGKKNSTVAGSPKKGDANQLSRRCKYNLNHHLKHIINLHKLFNEDDNDDDDENEDIDLNSDDEGAEEEEDDDDDDYADDGDGDNYGDDDPINGYIFPWGLYPIIEEEETA